jgi:hypothetical protein
MALIYDSHVWQARVHSTTAAVVLRKTTENPKATSAMSEFLVLKAYKTRAAARVKLITMVRNELCYWKGQT